jgi:hypothetical protein
MIEAMRIDMSAGGKMGIGTSSPSEILHLKTTADADLGLKVENDDTQAFVKVQSGGTALYGGNAGVNFISGSSFATAMHIDSNQKVGIGTTSPATALDVDGGANTDQATFSGTAGRGLKISTFSVGAADEGVDFDAQASGSTQAMTFSVGGAEKVRIDGNGDVGIGTTDPVAALHVIGGQLFTNTLTANTSSACHFSNVLSNGAYRIRFDAANSVVGSIQVTTSGTVYNTSSDYRLKENIVTDWDATTRLKQLKPSRFNFKVDKDKTVDGFIAHEVSSIVPEAVSGEKDAVDENGNIESQLMDQSKLIPLLTKSLQEAIARIDTLEAEVKTLKGE